MLQHTLRSRIDFAPFSGTIQSDSLPEYSDMRTYIPTPPGFRRKYSCGRLVFPIVDTHAALAHETLKQTLLTRLGVVKCSMPDQIDCVRPHVRHRYMLKMDLKNAFESVGAFGMAVALDLDENFDQHWRYFFHERYGLIQGAPASPILFYLYMKEMVEPELAELCSSLGLTWTRYVDDFLFSAQRFPKGVVPALTELFARNGFTVNRKKTVSLDTFHEPMEHLGIVLCNQQARITDATRRKLMASKPRTAQRTQLLRWQARVLALNNH